MGTVVAAASGGLVFILVVAAYVLFLLPLMGIFSKAGQPGWAAFVPIYNFLILMKVIGRQWWWILLLLIPLVNIVIFIIVYYDLSRSFGHGVGFTIGLIIPYVNWIFLMILWLGASEYRGPAATWTSGPPAAA